MNPNPPRVLVTAFEPFDRRPANRSQRWLEAFVREAVRRGLAHRVHLAAALLPVDYVRLPRALRALWLSERPDLWVLTGESNEGDVVRVERVAINLLDAPIPDNAGRRRTDAPVVRGGPGARFTRVDVRRAVRALEQGGVKAAVSLTAGSYCCNQAYYHALALAAARADARVLFLHLPRRPWSRGRPAPRLNDAARGLAALVLALAAPSPRVRRPRATAGAPSRRRE